MADVIPAVGGGDEFTRYWCNVIITLDEIGN
jgi:hypothetical protein